ncbi:MAG: ATP synthase subunit I [Deltaproteobacteria bacterium]|nr:ATP synthase subunit I [Deltaproteobacteria bacterium]
MNPTPLIVRVLAVSAILGAISALTSGVYFGLPAAVSSLVGTATGAANFALLARFAGDLLNETAPNKTRSALLLGLKFIALVALVGVLLVGGHVRGGPFMAGLSTVMLAIVGVGLFNPDDSAPTDSP